MKKDKKNTIAVLLLGFGAPDSPLAIEPFLRNVFSHAKVEITDEKIRETHRKYELIGGSSPLLKITREQASLLEKKLNSEGGNFKVYIGMRYWHPFIHETVKEIINDEITNIIALSLSPFYSKITTGSNIRELKRVLSKYEKEIKITYIDSWYDNRSYLNALSEKLREGLSLFPEDRRSNVQVIFSAHSLPKKVIEEGDPYLRQLKTTINEVIKQTGPISWHLSFQSRGASGEWLEPETDVLIEKLAEKNCREILLVPISFISDNIEILYDIDIVFQKLAESRGITLCRTSCFNSSPEFIDVLHNVVIEHIDRNR